MTRTQTLLVTTAMALALPLASAMAQSDSSCGPETWSTEKMTYTKAPCTAAEAVGTSGPTASGSGNSTTMTKQEMKQGGYGYAEPMQNQAALGGSPYASMGNGDCGLPNAPAITDEYGRKYTCRGDRIR